MTIGPYHYPVNPHRLARRALFSFVLTFLIARAIVRFESRHFRAFLCLAFAVVGFGIVLYLAGHRLGALVGPKLRDLELSSSP